MNRLVTAIWSGTLIAAAVGVVPTVIGLLQRALKAAQSIDRYTAEILTAGVGVAGNTASVAALKETLTVAPGLLAGAESIERHAAAIEHALADASGATEEQP